MKQRKEHTDNYLSLFGFILLVALYLSILYLQANSMKTFEVSTAHYSLLPDVSISPFLSCMGIFVDSVTHLLHQGLDGTGHFSFNTISDVYRWIDTKIIQVS